MKWSSWVSLVALVLVIGVVVYSSLRIGGVRCEVCVEFRGREACRAVDGQAEDETRRAGVTNACAMLASGVTDTMACERTTPTKAACKAP
jgi:hypothetical protein